MERSIIGGAVGIFMLAVYLCLHNHKLNSGDCYSYDRQYCVIKLVEDEFYNVECTYDLSYRALFFGSRKRFYEVDMLETQSCPKNIKEI